MKDINQTVTYEFNFYFDSNLSFVNLVFLSKYLFIYLALSTIYPT